jgi:hypothetical protein
MTTTNTNKLRLRLAILFRAMTARATSATCVARVNERYDNARQLSLVDDELPQLEERPARNLCALTSPKPFLNSSSNPFQILKGYPALSAYSRGNKFLTGAVIRVRAKARFLPTLTSEQSMNGAWTFSRLRLLGSLVLQRLTERVMPLARLFDFRAGEYFTVRSGSDVRYSEVNADEVGCGQRCFVGQVNRAEQKPASVFPQYKIALSCRTSKSLALILAHDERHNHAPAQSKQAYAIKPFETHHALVVGHRSVFAKLRQFVLIPLVRLADLCDAAHCHLRRQIEVVAQFSVMQLLKPNFICASQLKSLSRQPRGGGIEPLKRFAHLARLLSVGQELYLQSQLHTCNYTRIGKICLYLISEGLRASRFPPVIYARGKAPLP